MPKVTQLKPRTAPVFSPDNEGHLYSAAQYMDQGFMGGFARAIGAAYFQADLGNRAVLVTAFEHLFERAYNETKEFTAS
jgi:hypothetical protein